MSTEQSGTGGFFDPLLGTLILTLIGLAISLPLGVVCAVWMTEYGRPSWLARVVESSIEIVAGTPDIVIAIFGLAVFQLPLLAPFSFTSEGGGVYGRSFIAAGAMMSLLALPPLYVATRDGLQAVPGHMREAAFALGKTRITTIRRVLLPNVRSNIATGATLGISRIIGSTAIVLILLGGFLRIETQGSVPAAQRAAGDRLHAHELHLLQLSRRRRRRAAEGLRGSVPAAGLRAGAEPRRGTYRPSACESQRARRGRRVTGLFKSM